MLWLVSEACATGSQGDSRCPRAHRFISSVFSFLGRRESFSALPVGARLTRESFAVLAHLGPNMFGSLCLLDTDCIFVSWHSLNLYSCSRLQVMLVFTDLVVDA